MSGLLIRIDLQLSYTTSTIKTHTHYRVCLCLHPLSWEQKSHAHTHTHTHTRTHTHTHAFWGIPMPTHSWGSPATDSWIYGIWYRVCGTFTCDPWPRHALNHPLSDTRDGAFKALSVAPVLLILLMLSPAGSLLTKARGSEEAIKRMGYYTLSHVH